MTKKDKNQILRNGLSCSRFKQYQVVENIAEILSGKKEMGFTFVVAEWEERERESRSRTACSKALCTTETSNVLLFLSLASQLSTSTIREFDQEQLGPVCDIQSNWHLSMIGQQSPKSWIND